MFMRFRYFLFVSLITLPNLTLAQILPTGDRTEWGWQTLGQTIGNVVEIALGLVAAIAIIYIIIGGYQYIMAFGNPEMIAHAKNTIIWAIIGLILALASVLIVEYIGQFISPHTPDVPTPTAPQPESGNIQEQPEQPADNSDSSQQD